MVAHLARIYTISENEYIRHYATNRPGNVVKLSSLKTYNRI